MLTYAGEPLLIPTGEEGARLQDWLERNYDLPDVRLWGDAQSRYASARQSCRSRFEVDKGLGLPVVNWPAAPPPRINTLYWPTGATRWAFGFFLCTETSLTKILKTVRRSGVQKAVLGIGDDALGHDPLSPYLIDMWLLPPRPVTSFGEQLVLLPLVDERYFWQFKSIEDTEVTTSTTWSSLITTLAGKLGVSIETTTAIEAAYLKPDPVEFTRRYDNAALLLEAAAWSVGRRVVRRINGSVRLESYSSAFTVQRANTAKNWRRLSGGDYSAVGTQTPGLDGDLPAKLLFTFRKIKQHLLRKNGQVYTVEKSGNSYPPKVAGKTLTIHCAAYADYDLTDTILNDTALGDLATQIKVDFYNWYGVRYDYTYAGIFPWELCGFDDAVTFTFGRPIDGELKAHIDPEVAKQGGAVNVRRSIDCLAHTRVQTLPLIWPELNCCSDPAAEIVEPRLLAVPDSDIAAGDTGTVSLYDAYGSDTGKDVTARNVGQSIWAATKKGIALGIGDAEWDGGLLGGAASSLVLLYFETASDRDPSLGYFSATNLVALHGTAPSAPLTVYDADFLFPRALAGGHGTAVYDETNARYQCLFVEQRCILARAQINTPGGMSGSAAESVPIDNFTALSPPPFGLVPSTLPTTAINRQRHRGRDNQYVVLVWNDELTEWNIIDVEKQQAVVLFDLRYSSNKVQVKQAYAAVESDEDLSALTWTDKITTTTCP